MDAPDTNPVPEWQKRGLNTGSGNSFLDALLISVFNLPGIEKTLTFPNQLTLEEDASFMGYLGAMRGAADQKESDASLNRIRDALVRVSSKDRVLVDVPELFKQLIMLDMDGKFAHVFLTRAYRIGTSGAAHLATINVPTLSDFDARLCHPASTQQNFFTYEMQFPNTVAFACEKIGDLNGEAPFRCSKAPLRFPQWQGNSAVNNNVPPPTKWSDWYQLIGVISGHTGYATATILAEGDVWKSYSGRRIETVANFGEIKPRMLIFGKIYVPRYNEEEYLAYTRKRMLAGAKWYDDRARSSSIRGQKNETSMDDALRTFHLPEWNERLNSKEFLPVHRIEDHDLSIFNPDDPLDRDPVPVPDDD